MVPQIKTGIDKITDEYFCSVQHEANSTPTKIAYSAIGLSSLSGERKETTQKGL